VSELPEGADGYAALAQTPFYLEAGGQVSDVGQLHADGSGASADVQGVARIAAGLPRLHRIHMTSGTLRERDIITADVDAPTRDATRRNHTATHLLHAALRNVLGSHVKQAGSLVAPDRLRFDFVHASPVSPDQVLELERIVNEQICRNTPVVTEERSTQDAIAAGAMALFGEKYGDRVRVVSIPGFSMELCGGTHCRATGDIGFFTILSEGGVAAGVRRIEALTGAGAVQHYQTARAALEDVLGALGTTAERGRVAVEHLQTENKRLTREVTSQRQKAAIEGFKDAFKTHKLGDITFKVLVAKAWDKETVRTAIDSLRAKLDNGVVLVASVFEDRAQLAAGVTPDLTNRIHAGHLIKTLAPIVGGKGGGRPDFAEAGGKDPSRVEQELEAQSLKALEGLIEAGSGRQG
jgi:alanyl-tRNA synthetase